MLFFLRYGSSRSSYSSGDYHTPSTTKSAREVHEEVSFSLEEVVRSVVFVTSDENDSEVSAEMVLENRTNHYSSWYKK